jgi:hypothetical protein
MAKEQESFMSYLNDPAYWLERADQARQMAKSLAYQRPSKQMLVVAEGFEQMAKMAEEMLVVIKDGTSPFAPGPQVNQSAKSGALLRPAAPAYRFASSDASLAVARRQRSM